MKYNALISTARLLQQHELYTFHSATLADLLGLNKVRVAQLLGKMTEAGLTARIEHGKYLLLGLSPEQTLANPLHIASHLVTPSYISFWSALHYYGFTEQSPYTSFVATTRRKSPITFGKLRFQFVCLQPGAFFGYRRQQHAGLPVVIADEVKAVLDSLIFPDYAGGMSEAARALHNALEQLDTGTLLEYAALLSNPSLGSRLGFLLELFGKPVDILPVSKGPVKLDPQKPREGAYNARWRIYTNLDVEQLFV